jgi:hypothetical protein
MPIAFLIAFVALASPSWRAATIQIAVEDQILFGFHHG